MPIIEPVSHIHGPPWETIVYYKAGSFMAMEGDWSGGEPYTITAYRSGGVRTDFKAEYNFPGTDSTFFETTRIGSGKLASYTRIVDDLSSQATYSPALSILTKNEATHAVEYLSEASAFTHFELNKLVMGGRFRVSGGDVETRILFNQTFYGEEVGAGLPIQPNTDTSQYDYRLLYYSTLTEELTPVWLPVKTHPIRIASAPVYLGGKYIAIFCYEWDGDQTPENRLLFYARLSLDYGQSWVAVNVSPITQYLSTINQGVFAGSLSLALRFFRTFSFGEDNVGILVREAVNSGGSLVYNGWRAYVSSDGGWNYIKYGLALTASEEPLALFFGGQFIDNVAPYTGMIIVHNFVTDEFYFKRSDDGGKFWNRISDFPVEQVDGDFGYYLHHVNLRRTFTGNDPDKAPLSVTLTKDNRAAVYISNNGGNSWEFGAYITDTLDHQYKYGGVWNMGDPNADLAWPGRNAIQVA